MSEKVRIAIIGAGLIAREFHLPSLILTNEAEIVGCADIDEEKVKQFAHDNQIEFFTDDYHRLLSRDDVDAVVVATYHSNHASIAIDAITDGKHVLIQKPMATTMEDADRLVAAAAGRDRVVMALPYMYSAAFMDAREMINSGAIGRITMARSRVAHSGPGQERGWFYQKKIAEGGALFDMGVYAIWRLVALLGPAKRVAALISNTTGRGDVDENAVITLEFTNGAIGTAETSWTQQATREGDAIYGTDGTIILNHDHSPQIEVFSKQHTFHRQPAWEQIDTTARDREMPTAHQHFIDVIKGRAGLRSTVKRGRHIVEIMTAASESRR
ncbi:MAG: Gfo/Idh/MocA family oxidoreductase, partial [Armatimonadetes bacterium]|nr:Gfo/Idh/MocA family oxidoreductase [Armatimonadota bacterium]